MRILIVRTDRIGDVVLTLPMAAAVREALPKAHIAMLVREYTAPIVRMSPDVDDVVLVRPKLSILATARLMRSANADAIFFPNPGFSLAAAAFLAGIPKRVGTSFRWYSWLFTDRLREHRKYAERHEAEYNLRMLRTIGIDAIDRTASLRIPNASVVQTDRWCASEFGSGPYAVLHIPTGGSSKDWPIDRFLQLSERLSRDRNLAIVWTGTQSDAEFLLSARERIRKAGTAVHLFIGRPLEELAALLAKASVVVSNSTGPGHLAAMLGTPGVCLYPLPLALSKARWGLRGKMARNIAPKPIQGCPKCEVCTCMERIAVEDVLETVEQLLK